MDAMVSGAPALGATNVREVGKVFSMAGRPEIVLSDCSFRIEPGKLTVLLGPSGCGKSTLVKLIAGYDQPSVGSVEVDGRQVTEPGSDRLVVFQETALFPWMTILENVAYGPIQSGMTTTDAEREAKKLIGEVGLAGFESRYPDELSGGMQRRAEVARAIINRPGLLLLDEPFRGLDHMTRGLMQEYFLALFERHRVTTLFVTSEVDEGIFLADRLVLLTYKPTRVKAIIDVPLPRPRTFQMQTSAVYNEIKGQALDLLYEEAVKGFASGTAAARDMERIVQEAKANR